MGGPVEGARDERPPVHDSELVVHVTALLVVAHLDPYKDTTASSVLTDTVTRASATPAPGRGLPRSGPSPPGGRLTGVPEEADLGALQPHVLRVGDDADADAAAVEEADGVAQLRAGEGEEADFEGAAGGEEAPQEAAEGAVTVRQRAGAGPRRRPGPRRLGQQRLGAAGRRGEEEHLASGPGPGPPPHRQGQAQRRHGRRQRQPGPPLRPRRPHAPSAAGPAHARWLRARQWREVPSESRPPPRRGVSSDHRPQPPPGARGRRGVGKDESRALPEAVKSRCRPSSARRHLTEPSPNASGRRGTRSPAAGRGDEGGRAGAERL